MSTPILWARGSSPSGRAAYSPRATTAGFRSGSFVYDVLYEWYRHHADDAGR